MTHSVLIVALGSEARKTDEIVRAALAAGALVRRVRVSAPNEAVGIWERCAGHGRLQTMVFPEKELRHECASGWNEVYFSDVDEARRWRSVLTTATHCRFLGIPPTGDVRFDGMPWVPVGDGAWRISGELFVKAKPSRIIVVGAGIAGAFATWELTRRGIRVDVIDGRGAPAAGASALRAGIIHPHWQADDGPTARLTRLGFARMTELLKVFPEAFDACGVMDVAQNEMQWEQWTKAVAAGRPFAMPTEEARLIQRDEAVARTGLPLARGGWWFPRAGLVRPSLLVRRLLEASGARVLMGAEVRIDHDEDGWIARFREGGIAARADGVVVAAALDAPALIGADDALYGLTGLYGRISLLRDTDFSGVRAAVTGHGYLSKTEEGFCGVGATYEQGRCPVMSSEDAHGRNLGAFAALLENGGMPSVCWGGFYEGVRAVARDRMPSAGPLVLPERLRERIFRGRPEIRNLPVEPGLWGIFGMGSRGLTWGRLMAEHLASDIAGEPSPLPVSLIRATHPARFIPDELVRAS